MALPSHRDFEDLCDDVIAYAERLRRQGPEVLRRAKIGAGGGYRALTYRTKVSGSRTGDPTSDAAINAVDDPRADPIRDLAWRMADELRTARKSLEVADSAAKRTRPPDPSPDPDPGELWCVSCLRFEIHNPEVVRAGRCDFCATWRSDHDLSDPPESVLRERQRGGRQQAHESDEAAPTPGEPRANGSALSAAQRLLGERQR